MTSTKVDRVRNDGNWITGDPSDTAMRPKGTNGTPWSYPPRLYVQHQIGGGPLPDFPGWDTPRFGFGRGDIIHMEYLPTRPAPATPQDLGFLF